MNVVDITCCLDRLTDSGGEESAVMAHAGTHDNEKCSCLVLEEKCILLGRKLKAKTSKDAFLKLLPVPCTGPDRQEQMRDFNL